MYHATLYRPSQSIDLGNWPTIEDAIMELSKDFRKWMTENEYDLDASRVK